MDSPVLDYHGFAPELILTLTIVAVLIADLLFEERQRWQTSRIAAAGVLASLVPVLTLAGSGANRSMLGGSYVVDNYSLAFKGLFLVVTYFTILISVDYIADGKFAQGEFYFLLLCSVLGMTVMASSRDLIGIFVALETISIPTYILVGLRKHDVRSNEASVKYYLFGVLSSAVMLYGMSIVYGVAGSTRLSDIAVGVSSRGLPPLVPVAIFFTLVGFAFKVSAVPFHFWAPDTYEGAPTPVTAFLSVASKAGGFVAMLTVIYFGFFTRPDAWRPLMWALAAASMTLGNLAAIRQTNIVRMLAYSSIAQGGFMLVPFAAMGESPGARTSSLEAVVIYLLIYAAMNLGAFGVIIAVARRTQSGEISSFAGLFTYAPGLTVLMSIFLFSLAGIPPLAGWFAKFVMFRSVLDAGSPAAVTLGAIAAVNAVVAFYYYGGVAREMWFRPVADGADTNPIEVQPALGVAVFLTAAIVVLVGVYPQVFARIGELAANAT